MIAIVRVTITHGEIGSPPQLVTTARRIYPDSPPPELVDSVLDSVPHIADMCRASVYTCSPTQTSVAWFFWNDAQDFEVIVGTAFRGIYYIVGEALVRMVTRSRSRRHESNILISLQSYDAKTMW
jgi:hypothetical protein